MALHELNQEELDKISGGMQNPNDTPLTRKWKLPFVHPLDKVSIKEFVEKITQPQVIR